MSIHPTTQRIRSASDQELLRYLTTTMAFRQRGPHPLTAPGLRHADDRRLSAA